VLAEQQGRALLLGRGTCSVAELLASGAFLYRDYDRRTMDANRIAHNEYLRVLYEWGGLGLLIFLGWLAGLVLGQWRALNADACYQRYLLLALTLVLAALLGFENMFAAAMHPSGAVVSLLLAMIAVGPEKETA
jgi:O-antigen ligase